jgi:hypothetical protein
MPLVISSILATINIKCNVCGYLNMNDEFVVNGLPLPPLLVELMKHGKWQHPSDKVLREIIPFLLDPVDFLKVEYMCLESSGFLADDEFSSKWNHEVRGSQSTEPVELPWLDVDKAVTIAVNREIGADVGIALDYRTNMEDPRVVASEWRGGGHYWREVTPTFSEFVARIGIKLT